MEAVAKTPERQAFYKKIDGKTFRALERARRSGHARAEQRVPAAAWRFDEIRDAMMEAGNLITAKEAERRVLVLENPGLRGQSKITTSCMPASSSCCRARSRRPIATPRPRCVSCSRARAPTPRSTANDHAPGDFVITPPMTWHDHGNETAEPMFWLDGLDIPMVQFLDASFAEGLKEDQQKITRPAGDSYARYGANLLPIDERRKSKTSPIFNYPYACTREALETGKQRDEWDACHGLKMRTPTPRPAASRCRPSALSSSCCRRVQTARYRSTDATVFAAIEGRAARGRRKTFEWGPRDLFVVPSWHRVTHEADADGAVLVLRSSGAAGARSVPRGQRERLRI